MADEKRDVELSGAMSIAFIGLIAVEAIMLSYIGAPLTRKAIRLLPQLFLFALAIADFTEVTKHWEKLLKRILEALDRSSKWALSPWYTRRAVLYGFLGSLVPASLIFLALITIQVDSPTAPSFIVRLGAFALVGGGIIALGLVGTMLFLLGPAVIVRLLLVPVRLIANTRRGVFATIALCIAILDFVHAAFAG